MKEIYFDNASTALPIESQSNCSYGNPSTTHVLGVKAYNALEQARKDLAQILGCDKDEVVLTSGGTESNNLAIIGYAIAHKRKGVRYAALPWAHPSVTLAMKHAVGQGLATEASELVCAEAEISFAEGANFTSIPQVCHETGNKYDVEKISFCLKKSSQKNIVHVDGAQGFCKEKLNLKNIDLYSFSGHKIHAPAGTGGLMVKKGVRLSALFFGGGQEAGLRAGTQNVQGAASLALAAKKLHKNMDENSAAVLVVKSELLKLTEDLSDVHINAAQKSSPYILNMSFIGAKGEVLANMLSEKGIYVSTGAACKVGKSEIPALKLMGFGKEIADSAVRFSFSPHNTVEEARLAREAVIECVAKLRGLRR